MFDLTVDILQRSTLVLNDEGQNTIQYNEKNIVFPPDSVETEKYR